MLKEERFNYILQQIKKRDKVTYDFLAKELAVSADTVRRDIEALYRNGLLTKIRGGAMKRALTPLAFQDRIAHFSENKNIIAVKAQPFIQQGQTIFMDGGTTICAVATHFPENASLRVVTNNQALLPILLRFKEIEIIMLGGQYNRNTETNVGMQTCKQVSGYVADLYFMGTCAIDTKFGVTASVYEDAEVKQAMRQASLKTMVVTDSHKLGSTDHFSVCSLKEIDVMITDLPSNHALLDPFRYIDIMLV